MLDVYYYVPADSAENAVDCGLKLSEWAEKTVTIDGEEKRCIVGLLNPRDDMKKYSDMSFKCLKLEVAEHYCRIADKYLYLAGCENDAIMKIYSGNIRCVEQYTFGDFRLPEVLIMSTVIGTSISILNKTMDFPVLYDNSEKLYLDNIIERERENDHYINDLLYHYLNSLAQEGRAVKNAAPGEGITIFETKQDNQLYILKNG